MAQNEDSPASNCSVPDNHIVLFAAEPDISGIGVTIAFLVPAISALLVSAMSFRLGSAARKELDDYDWNMAYIGKLTCYYLIQRYIRADAQKPRKIEHSSEAPRTSAPRISLSKLQNLQRGPIAEAIPILRDLQLVTGVALILIVFMQQGDITAYHFSFIRSLAWLSLTVSLSTDFAIAPKVTKNPVSKHTRFVYIMILLLSILAAELILNRWENMFPLDSLDLPMRCFWNTSGALSNDPSFISNIILFLPWLGISEIRLFYSQGWFIRGLAKITRFLNNGFSLLILKLYHTTGKTWKLLNQRSDDPSEKGYSRWFPPARFVVELLLCLVTTFCFSAWFSLIELLGSQTLELLRNAYLVTYFTVLLLGLRGEAQYYGEQGKGNSWGLSQVLPCMLLGLPLLNIAKSIWNYRYIKRKGMESKVVVTEANIGMTESLSVSPNPQLPQQQAVDTASEGRVDGVQDDGPIPALPESACSSSSSTTEMSPAVRVHNAIYDKPLARFILGMTGPLGLLITFVVWSTFHIFHI